jgi:hypothetical protein
LNKTARTYLPLAGWSHGCCGGGVHNNDKIHQKGAIFGFGNDGQEQGEWGIMVEGVGVGGNENKDVKVSQMSPDKSTRDAQNCNKKCV